MKKRVLSVLIIMALVLSCVGVQGKAAIASQIVEVFVAKNGKDDAKGTIDDPFATIDEARDYLRKAGLSEEKQGVINIRKGVYNTMADNPTVELTEEDSNITITAYNNEVVRITGTTTLNNNNFKKLSEVTGDQYSSSVRLPSTMKDKVFVYDLGAENIAVGKIYKNGFNWPKQPFTPELIVDEAIQTLAKYPNSGVLSMTQILCGKTKDGKNEDQTAKAAGANEGERPRNYIFDKTDTPKTYEEMLIMKAPVFYCRAGLESRIGTWAPPTQAGEPQGDQVVPNALSDNTKYETDGWLSGYFENNYASEMSMIYSVNNEKQTINCKYPSLQGVQDKRIQLTAINLLCELDTQKEYYIDRYNGNDVLYYYPVGGSIGNKEITLTSSTEPFFSIENAKNVNIKNIVMDGTTGYGVTFMNCENCTVDGCELYNISLDAIRIGKNNDKMTTDPQYEFSGGGKNITVRNCIIHDMGCGGVYMSGGDEKSLEASGHLVENCEFYSLSRLQTYTPAVYMEGVGGTAKNNYIHDCPHMVIQIMGNDMKVLGNHFNNVGTNTSDQGAIYSGRNFTWLGNVVEGNYFENLKSGVYAIYMDDGMSGLIIKNNIFKDIKGSAVFSNCGFGHQISDNVFLNVSSGVYYKSYGGSRPIANEKILQYRYYRIFREGSLEEFYNTKENINNIISHYADIYPYLGNRFFPETTDSSWSSNKDSFFVPSYQTLVRSIFINAGSKNITDNVKSLQDSNFDTKNYNPESVDELGLDLKTGKIAANSIIADNSNYGSAWIENWNNAMTIENAGASIKEYVPEPTEVPTASPVPTSTPLPTATPEATPQPSSSEVVTETPVPAIEKGDVNADGNVDSKDALEILKAAAKLVELTANGQIAADVNGDGNADASDALIVLKLAAKIIDKI